MSFGGDSAPVTAGHLKLANADGPCNLLSQANAGQHQGQVHSVPTDQQEICEESQGARPGVGAVSLDAISLSPHPIPSVASPYHKASGSPSA